jgi:Arc/MetJ family transcription regulator
MARTNIDIDDGLVHRVMVRYHLKTKREAVEYALRHLAGQPLSTSEALALGGSMPDFAAPVDDMSDSHDDDTAC